VLARYRAMEETASASIRDEIDAFEALLADPPPAAEE
jgi:hypothetical protein